MELSNLEEAVSSVEYEEICEEPVYVWCEGEPLSLPNEVTLTIRADDARTLGINPDNLRGTVGYITPSNPFDMGRVDGFSQADTALTNNYVTREDVQEMIDNVMRHQHPPEFVNDYDVWRNGRPR